MTWNGNTTVDGDQSVKDNRPRINGSFGYIETTMQNDHYWDDATSDFDGRHQFIQSPEQSADPTLGSSMDGALYLKDAAGRNEWFSRNSNGIFQVGPSFEGGTKAISDMTYTNIYELPDENVYGEILVYASNAINTVIYVDTASFVNADPAGGASRKCYVFGRNESGLLTFSGVSNASGRNIRAKATSGNSFTWTYRITWRAI